jgi:hypothetical protein
MAQVISQCPLTKHYVFMGMDIEAERFAFLPETFARKFCPFCACEHDWHKRDAKLVDRKPAPRHSMQRVS